MDVLIDGGVEEHADGWVDGWIDGWMVDWMDSRYVDE
jgi:hypothetical protein